MLKFLVVPEPVTLFGKLVYSFREGLLYVLDTASEFERPASHTRAAERLAKASEDCVPGAVLELKAEDWRLLNQAVEAGAPWGSWATRDEATGATTPIKVSARLMLSFTNAVNEATNTPPAAKA